MTTAFFEASKPYVMPNGGVLDTGEIASLDPTNAANMVAIANGIVVSSSAPSAPSAPAMTRIKFTATTMVANSPPLFDAGDVATFPSAISAQLIAAGLAVSN
jgi:DhnA family fructose-bisphosphate aldolase class Ia